MCGSHFCTQRVARVPGFHDSAFPQNVGYQELTKSHQNLIQSTVKPSDSRWKIGWHSASDVCLQTLHCKVQSKAATTPTNKGPSAQDVLVA